MKVNNRSERNSVQVSLEKIKKPLFSQQEGVCVWSEAQPWSQLPKQTNEHCAHADLCVMRTDFEKKNKQAEVSLLATFTAALAYSCECESEC